VCVDPGKLVDGVRHALALAYPRTMEQQTVSLRPIGAADGVAVGDFLHRYLNPRVPATAWTGVIAAPWEDNAPNHGYMLVDQDKIVGVNLAVYSQRYGPNGPIPVCNLAAFCVLEPYRAHSLRLVRALLAQRSYDFTDFSPSGNVVGLNERLGFKHINTDTRVLLNLPRLRLGNIRVTGDPLRLNRTLLDRDARVYRDHQRAAACRHVLVETLDTYAYMIFRRDRRKGLPVFASPLYVGGDMRLLENAWPNVASHLLVKHRLLATLAERRILDPSTRLGFHLQRPRPKMVKGDRLNSEGIDYLYSELALVEW
jgi:hypothetical protein